MVGKTIMISLTSFIVGMLSAVILFNSGNVSGFTWFAWAFNVLIWIGHIVGVISRENRLKSLGETK